MSENKNNNGYKSINFEDDFVESNANKINNVKEQHTLELYNDDMSRNAVKAAFAVINEDNSDVPKQKSTYGYDGKNKHNTLSKPANNNKTDTNGNVEYTYQSFDYDALNNNVKNGYKYSSNKKYDYTNTNFSADKINAEREARANVEKNKQILKDLQAEKQTEVRRSPLQAGQNTYRTVGEVQESIESRPQRPQKVNKKQQQTMIFRLCTTLFIVVILVCLSISIYLNTKLKSEIGTLKTQNETLTAENAQVKELQTNVDILEDELAKLKTDSGSQATTGNTAQAGDTTNSNTTNNGTSEQSKNEYTVKPGDTLASISKQFYNDANRYNEIYEANNLTSTNLVVGQKLLIP